MQIFFKLDGLKVGEFFTEADSCGVQSPLDRSHRAFKLVAHLDQRLAFKVESNERLPIEGSQPLQASPQLIRSFPRHQFFERRPRLGIDGHENLGIMSRYGRASNGSIDRKSDGDPSQPTGKPLGLSQLVQLTHRLNENVLRQFGRFGLIAKSPQRNREDGRFKLANEFAERHSTSRLGLQNDW